MTIKNPGQAVREQIRAGEWRQPTSGLAADYVQCNLVILAEQHASDFLRFCHANPKPCPLLAVSATPGDPTLPALGTNIDVRTDLPRYRHWVGGILAGECDDLLELWQDDAVAFALGCSFSFEQALQAANIDVRNVSEGVNVPMYRTNIACVPTGVFSADMVVSMRPMTPENAIRAIQICSRFPSVHGAPVHFGDPQQIGIVDINNPDFGDRVTVKPGEVPVFWACGVTPQVALEQAKLPLALTHSPGYMLVTDKLNTALAIF